MRNLTLGVLIVTGGTLAALPFRRSPAIPDASSHLSQSPTQATGTLQSALDPAPVHVLASSGSQEQWNSGQSFSRQEIPGLDEFIRDPVPAESSTFAVVDRSRSAIKPLTYDDLMAPITRPEPIQDRYQAIAAVGAVGANSRVQGKELAMELPPVEELEPALRNEFQQRFTSMKPSRIGQTPPSYQPTYQPSQPTSPARAGGALASSMIPRTPSLPELSQAPVAVESSQRQHYWIIQP